MTREIGIVSFAVAAIACVAAGLVQARRGGGGGGASSVTIMWLAAGGVCALLAIDVPVGVRFEITDFFRNIAREGGWYDQRRPRQAILIAALAGLVAAGLAGLLWGTRRWRWGTRLTLVGVMAALAIWSVEIASLHDVDRVLYLDVGPAMLIAWLWLAAATTATCGAAMTIVARR